MQVAPIKKRAVSELLLFAVLLFAGFIIMPIAMYLIGNQVFGEYEGGYGRFFGLLSKGMLNGHTETWFLVLSPWLAVQTIRAVRAGLRMTAQTRATPKT